VSAANLSPCSQFLHRISTLGTRFRSQP
jgi:hypothetical protein